MATLRNRFPHIARLRLIAACPVLDGLLHEADLRLLFDWIMLQLYGRTHTSNFVQLMQWTVEHGESESLQLVAEVTRDAVDRLPVTVLHIIDGCEGRTVAGVILDQALSEVRPELPAGARTQVGVTISACPSSPRPSAARPRP